jgi:glyoxylase I family protein
MHRANRKIHIKKMDHSGLIVRDLDRSRWFYADVLGLVEMPRPMNFAFRGAWFRGPSFEIHLIHADDTTASAGFGDPGEGGLTGLAHHLAFEVEDLDAALDYLRSQGIEILSGPMPRGDGVLQAYVFDPDRNFLEFFARDGDGPSVVEERYEVGHQREVSDATA